MDQSLWVNSSLEINAPIEEVWKALIDPDITQQYMFGCEVECDWKIGDPLLWKGAADGVIYVKGELVALEKPHRFTFTVFDPNAKYEDVPENYLTAAYTLTPKETGTLIEVAQGDYAKVADGQKRYEDTIKDGGWDGVLAKMKEIVEG